MKTLRQAASEIRKLLAPYNCKVSGKTVNFSGFGFGSAGFIDINCEQQLPIEAITSLEKSKTEIQSEGNKFIISLCGLAYPFGYKI